MVTVALLLDVVVLAAAVIVTVLSLDPLDGDTVHHDWLDETVHESLLVTVTVLLSPVPASDSAVGETESAYAV